MRRLVSEVKTYTAVVKRYARDGFAERASERASAQPNGKRSEADRGRENDRATSDSRVDRATERIHKPIALSRRDARGTRLRTRNGYSVNRVHRGLDSPEERVASKLGRTTERERRWKGRRGPWGTARHFRPIKSNTGGSLAGVARRELIIRKTEALISTRCCDDRRFIDGTFRS